jgi:uncharacterized membrane protein YgcG
VIDLNKILMPIRKIELNDEENIIIITIPSNDEAHLYDYAINLYEDYGLTGVDDDGHWIVRSNNKLIHY